MCGFKCVPNYTAGTKDHEYFRDRGIDTEDPLRVKFSAVRLTTMLRMYYFIRRAISVANGRTLHTIDNSLNIFYKNMMNQLILSIESIQDIDVRLTDYHSDKSFQTVFIQIYTSISNKVWLENLAAAVLGHFPEAVVTGATTSGEIINGYTTTGKTVIIISFFRSSEIELLALPCRAGDEKKAGECIKTKIAPRIAQAAGIMFLCTAISMDSSEFIKPISTLAPECPIFGGAAGYLKEPEQSFILCGQTACDSGIAIIMFIGKELFLNVSFFLGWKPFSKEMTITAASGKTAESIDGFPAFLVYRHYLGIENDHTFGENAVGFSFIIERNHVTIARVPISVTENNGIMFGADIYAGEKFRIGYADPAAIIEESHRIHEKIRKFKPDAVFLFSCSNRRQLLRDDIQQETLPFAQIAPTAGFYTAGEFFGSSTGIELLNSSIVVVGIREGENKNLPEDTAENKNHPYTIMLQQHTKAISSLIHFIETVTGELEEANRQLALLATSDKLTGLYNRRKLDEILSYEIARAGRYRSTFSVILTDIDLFKKINDTYGHLTGDKILIEFAEWLRYTFIRKTDTVGRWGGEEFLCIIPDNQTESGRDTAEEFIHTIAAAPFCNGIHITCSAGVTAYRKGDTAGSIMSRVDSALYKAKEQGRNTVVSC
jgi:diguanylate cyclase (GGDEF)-like protein